MTDMILVKATRTNFTRGTRFEGSLMKVRGRIDCIEEGGSGVGRDLSIVVVVVYGISTGSVECMGKEKGR